MQDWWDHLVALDKLDEEAGLGKNNRQRAIRQRYWLEVRGECLMVLGLVLLNLPWAAVGFLLVRLLR